MGALLDLAIAIPVVAVTGAGAAGMSTRARIARAGQVVPGAHVSVPVGWQWSPRRAPSLHRRLQRSCRLVLAATGGPDAYRRRRRSILRRSQVEDTSVLRTTGRALLEQAVRVDVRLVAADRGGRRWLRLQLMELAGEVARIEASSQRLARLARAMDDHLDAAAGLGRDPTAEADMLMDAMEAAIADLGRDARSAR